MTEYIVFARKYRPQTLSDLVGQENLAQTLRQSIAAGKLPHAIILHGIRGVGKTTTARIIAKGLNCEKGPTVDPCGTCPSCQAIGQDRHLDVIEMDAASHTGVDDVREVIETAKYKAVQGKYKVYIIDEVHMLSKSAFNALLKTLEEPPPFVHFIFATTEINKVPDTVLSRCMRFDLARMDLQAIKSRLQYIAEKENFAIEEDAATLIARAADGSMRDSLSLLDQAYALSHHGNIKSDIVRDMLGLSSKEALFKLLSYILKGEVDNIISYTQELFLQGADPFFLLKDVLDSLYAMITLKAAPRTASQFSNDELSFYQDTAKNISMPSLLQVWQILSDRYPKLYHASDAKQSLQVIFLQVAYTASLPPLNQLLENSPIQLNSAPKSQAVTSSSLTQATPTQSVPEKAVVMENPVSEEKKLATFTDLLEFLHNKRELILHTHLTGDASLSSYKPGYIALHLKPSAPKNLTQLLKSFLDKNTQENWVVEDHGHNPAVLSIQEMQAVAFEEKKQEALAHPAVADLLDTFPGARVSVREE